MGINLIEALGALPDGTSIPMDVDQAAEYLAHRYILSPRDERRRKDHQLRAQLYKDSGHEAMEAYIDEVFKDPTVRELRKEWVAKSNFSPLLKRVINEISTVYAKNPTRRVGGSEENQSRFAQYNRIVRKNQVMRRANAYLNLHRQVAIGPRVREDGTPTVDLVTPDMLFAAAHPRDATLLVGLGVSTPIVEHKKPIVEHWTVWGADIRFRVDGRGRYVAGTVAPNPFARVPYVLASIEPPQRDILDESDGCDLVAAQLASWFEHVLLLKESKSLNKQVAVIGDTSQMVRGQIADTEADLEFPEGAVPTEIDRGVDLEQYIKTADYIMEGAAGNYGIPPSVLKHEGATSGFEIELRRIGIRERREIQIEVLRDVERELVELEAEILAAQGSPFAFDPTGWSIDFGEVETPMDRTTELAILREEKALSLTSTIKAVMKRNPDLSYQDAIELLRENIEEEEYRQGFLINLKSMNAGMDTDADSALPVQNGERGAQALRERVSRPADGEPIPGESEE